eukprot:CAMPEP_0118632164 /NCGR_PEP_ID=MMETSP0785-20121206/294_1 /TAXON_ID=91992 /ORGANISM="Bolidomonas pacifica, Strain CCMP 1866" /LENGTH=362 /DNA_ID=CAMNT_0006522907 /DNA_START=240 /DNA_END=1328 /DNA_ORIENTATION=+
MLYSTPLHNPPITLSTIKGLGLKMQARIYVTGGSSHAGKSTFTMLLLSALLKLGIKSLGYVKPTTQCEKKSITTIFCEHNSILTTGSPVVYYKGYTRSYLKGQTSTRSETHDLIASTIDANFSSVDVLVIDGVGYPAVGSITDTSNASVCRTLRSPAIVVTPTGVGNAVDTYDYCRCYMLFNGCDVLGGVVNGVAREGFYDLKSVREYVGMGLGNKGEVLYGVVPKFEELVDIRDDDLRMESMVKEGGLDALTDEFLKNVDVGGIVRDAQVWAWRNQPGSEGGEIGVNGMRVERQWQRQRQQYQHQQQHHHNPPPEFSMTTAPPPPPPHPKTSVGDVGVSKGVKRTREEIEKEAKAQGAKGG